MIIVIELSIHYWNYISVDNRKTYDTSLLLKIKHFDQSNWLNKMR